MRYSTNGCQKIRSNQAEDSLRMLHQVCVDKLWFAKLHMKAFIKPGQMCHVEDVRTKYC